MKPRCGTYFFNSPRFEIPNKDTIDAIKEVEAMKKDNSIGKAYTDVDRMMEEFLA